ncbi:Orexin receptor type 2 [Stylophora pistillata]|uniref:Orexin receptor type 2 n=2 Tax=Stylophora pistillata TaxID=50429 RepID=A0A2B4SS18_STYPI|nr:Orexin receptor type 2 [Stylophora pistillata]
MRTTRNFLLVNLAVSDLTVALLCIPFDMVLKITEPDWPLGSAMCKILWPSMTLVTNSSAVTLAVISFDRYRAIVRPTEARFTTRQTGFIIAAIWLVSLLLVLPYVLTLKIVNNTCDEVWPSDTARQVYTVGLFVFQYTLPLTIIAFAYVKIVLKLREQSERMATYHEISKRPASPSLPEDNWSAGDNLAPNACDTISLASPVPERKKLMNGNLSKTHRLGHKKLEIQMHDVAAKLPTRKKQQTPTTSRTCRIKEAKRLEHNTKIVKMLVSVVLSYAICLLPNQVAWLWLEFGSGESWPHFNEFLIFGFLMVYINSSVNPLLYAGMNEEFRKGFIRIIKFQWRVQPQTL